jgi:hypothetical protein
MKPKKYFFVMLAVFLLLILAILGATIGGNALLQKESKKLTELKVQDKATEQQKSALAQAKKDIEKYKELETISKSIVPQDKDQAKTVREITKIAEDSGIRLKSFVFQSSNLGQAPVAAPKPAENESNASAPATPAAPPLSQVKPVEGIPGVYALEIIVSPQDKQSISYQNFLTFLERLESNRRTAHVDKISVSPNEYGVTFSLTLKAYVKP